MERITILRRDLYDARFQILEENSSLDQDDDDDEEREEESGTERKAVSVSDKENQRNQSSYIDANTDLIPGTYEGGLKTWEGGIDLVEVLHSFERRLREWRNQDDAVAKAEPETETGKGDLGNWIQGKKILEVGCGTGLPSLFILQRLVSCTSTPTSDQTTTIHLQDYNLSVLHLVTLPNLILAILPLSSLIRYTSTESGSGSGSSSPDHLELTDEVLEEFMSILKEKKIELKFSFGDWEGFGEELASEKDGFDLILTAETIYRQESVNSLIRALKNGIRRVEKGLDPKTKTTTKEVDEEMSSLALRGGPVWELPLTLVAAKVSILIPFPLSSVFCPIYPLSRLQLIYSLALRLQILYFGVGGGIRDFLDRVESQEGASEDVQVWQTGVGRKVVRVDW